MIITVNISSIEGIHAHCTDSIVVLLHHHSKTDVSYWNVVDANKTRLGYGAIYVWNDQQYTFELVDDSEVPSVVSDAGGRARYSIDVVYGVREFDAKKTLWFTVDAVSEDVSNALDWVDEYLRTRFAGKPMVEWHEFGPGNP